MKKGLVIILVILALVTISISACTNTSTPSAAPSSAATKPATSAVASPTGTQPVAAGSPAEFFKNNTVTLICPMAAGAGSDYAARLFASYWTDATGGAMIVKNVTGGGGLVGTNNIAVAKPDGLTLGMGMLTTSYLGPMIFKDPAFQVDTLKQTWIGGVFEEPNMVAITAGLPYKTAKDLQDAKALKFGAVGPNSPAAVGDALLAEFLGLTNFKIITGYSGGSAVVLGMGKKEIDGFASPMTTVLSALDKGFGNKPAFTIITDKRLELYPDVPAITELTTMTPEKTELINASLALLSSCRVFTGPPNISADKVTYLRDTFKAITGMKPFQDQAKFYFPLWTTPMTGDEVLKFIQDAQKLPTDKIKAIVNKYASIS